MSIVSASHFRQAQETFKQAIGTGEVILSGPVRGAGAALFDQDAVSDNDAFALRPDGVGVFRLDGNKDFFP